jgi:hypothetical protein
MGVVRFMLKPVNHMVTLPDGVSFQLVSSSYTVSS